MAEEHLALSLNAGSYDVNHSSQLEIQTTPEYRYNLGSNFSVEVTLNAMGSQSSKRSKRPVKYKRFAGLPIAGGHAGLTFRGSLGLRFGLKF